ncbi:MAG: hypothetical protein A3H93_06050 [Rhodocyclales bacterium RIFCSPLOWO2_02_FULL_63_24]|nr:MAG: hypothetical protein A2040_12710 [Rhodocyclales bacterium GWA2_65_19]OHC68305.1 MAG: hypothetical protein A3H93_06050 [Rhodocyclales bacterium RIFCSPLOWO2_02_FULL_63_24]
MKIEFSWDRFAGVLLVLALHGAALWGLWAQRLIPVPQDVATLFVDFIAPVRPAVAPRVEAMPRRELPKPRAAEPPQARQLVAETAVSSPAESAVAPAPTPVIATPPSPQPVAAGPLVLGVELSVSCPERRAPSYPLLSRRLGETGTTLLRVEVDEQGQVAAAHVVTGSGHARLDEAALAAVRTWRCTPPQRNGQALRAVALQPFKFQMQGG